MLAVTYAALYTTRAALCSREGLQLDFVCNTADTPSQNIAMFHRSHQMYPDSQCTTVLPTSCLSANLYAGMAGDQDGGQDWSINVIVAYHVCIANRGRQAFKRLLCSLFSKLRVATRSCTSTVSSSTPNT